MAAITTLADRLRSGVPALAAWCGLPDPAIAGLLAREGFDAVVIDLQHGAIDFAATLRAIPLVAAAGKPALVRIPVGEFATASRVLDAGASAVISPSGRGPLASSRLAASSRGPRGRPEHGT